MNSPIGKIEELIADRQKQLDEAQKTLLKAEGRLRLAQEAVRDASDVVRQLEAEYRGLKSALDSISDLPSGRKRAVASKPRGPSDVWRSIFQYISSKGHSGASINDIEGYLQSINVEIQRGAIRSQLSNYKQKNVLEAVGDAVYKLTPDGAKLLEDAGNISSYVADVDGVNQSS
jgi:hypothetical protein